MAVQDAKSPLETLEKRIKNPLEGKPTRLIGLSQIAATHGTSVDAVIRLISDGRFSGGLQDPSLQGTFHVTPNVLFKGWKKIGFTHDISKVSKQTDVFPIDVSIEYASTNEESKIHGGVVVGFDHRIFPLVCLVDMDDSTGEPEVVLREAPGFEAVRAIYPLDDFAMNSLHNALNALR